MLAVLGLLFALGGWWLWKEWRIDACLGGGGEWNYSTSACDPLPL